MQPTYASLICLYVLLISHGILYNNAPPSSTYLTPSCGASTSTYWNFDSASESFGLFADLMSDDVSNKAGRYGESSYSKSVSS